MGTSPAHPQSTLHISSQSDHSLAHLTTGHSISKLTSTAISQYVVRILSKRDWYSKQIDLSPAHQLRRPHYHSASDQWSVTGQWGVSAARGSSAAFGGLAHSQLFALLTSSPQACGTVGHSELSPARRPSHAIFSTATDQWSLQSW